MKKNKPLLIGGFFMIMIYAFPGPVFTAEQDQTFLLNESQITGSVSPGDRGVPSWSNDLRYVEFPALSTLLPWEGVEEEDLNIPKEILDQLSQSGRSDQDSHELQSDQRQDNNPLPSP
ncbi:MAG: hypothetical protein ACE5FZ_06350 [Nitrospiria bacterium]